VWKLGWSPKPGGDFGTVFPEIPVEFLQEKEILKAFIYRINTLGTGSQSTGSGTATDSQKLQGRGLVIWHLEGSGCDNDINLRHHVLQYTKFLIQWEIRPECLHAFVARIFVCQARLN
jgi:hypothetical protein